MSKIEIKEKALTEIQEKLLECVRDVSGRLVQMREIVSIEEKRHRYQILKEMVEDLMVGGKQFLTMLKHAE